MIRLLLFGAVLLVSSVGAFFFYIPFLPTAGVVVILLGMALMFLIGAQAGGTQVLRIRVTELRARRLRLRRNAPSDDVNAPLALTAPSDE